MGSHSRGFFSYAGNIAGLRNEAATSNTAQKPAKCSVGPRLFQGVL